MALPCLPGRLSCCWKEDMTIVREDPPVRVSSDARSAIRKGHPWVFREGVLNPGPRPDGKLVSVVDKQGRFLARGYWEEEGAIAVRLMTRQRDDMLNRAFVVRALEKAIRRRELMIPHDTDVYRLVNGEGDRLPGITVDRVGQYLVTRVYSPGAQWILDHIYPELEKLPGIKGCYEQNRFNPGPGRKPMARLIFGEEAPQEVVITEDSLKYTADVTASMGVGFFPDYRAGRAMVRRLAPGRRVLNLFSYTGAFTVAAMAGGAQSVVSVDTMQSAHTKARRNLELNGFEASGEDFVLGDAYRTVIKFARDAKAFDFVIVDPPTFGSGHKGSAWNVEKYDKLLHELSSILEPDSLLLVSSNTFKLSAQDFERMIARSFFERPVTVLERIHQPADFPFPPGFPEGAYLKAYLLWVE